MPAIDLTLDADQPWPDLAQRGVVHLPDTTWQLAAIPRGMSSGATSLALRLDVEQGPAVVTETSLSAWIAATCALRGRYPDAFRGTPLEKPPDDEDDDEDDDEAGP